VVVGCNKKLRREVQMAKDRPAYRFPTLDMAVAYIDGYWDCLKAVNYEIPTKKII